MSESPRVNGSIIGPQHIQIRALVMGAHSEANQDKSIDDESPLINESTPHANENLVAIELWALVRES